MQRQINDRVKERQRERGAFEENQWVKSWSVLSQAAVFLSGFYQWTFQALSLKMHTVHLNTVIIKFLKWFVPLWQKMCQCFIVKWETWFQRGHPVKKKAVLSFFVGKQSESGVASVSVDLGTVLTWVAWQMMLASQTLTHLINLIYWKIRTYKSFQLLISSGNLAQRREKVSGCCACLENSKNHFWHYNHFHH